MPAIARRHAVKPFLVGAFALLTGPLTASAAVQTTGHYGAWDTFEGVAGDGRYVCGAGISDTDRSFSVLYQGDTLYIHLTKDSWDIPKGTPIKIIYQVDKADSYSLDGHGYPSDDGHGSVIEFNFDWTATDPDTGERYVVTFVDLLQSGLEVKFWFPNGNEDPWSGSLVGSRDALNKFAECAEALDARKNPSSGTTQPFSKGATQPFRN
jgi:hypothetical protein